MLQSALRGKPANQMRSPKLAKSLAVRRSVVFGGDRTSLRLEDGFWEGLKEIAKERGMSVPKLVASIKAERRGPNLTSALRVYVLEHYQAQLSALRPNA